MSISIKLGDFLYKNAFCIYKPLYSVYKRRKDAFEIELLKKYIDCDNVVLDIGANIGFYATLLASIVGQRGEVHCFEPDTRNFFHLKSVTECFENIFVNNKAVGPNSDTIKIYTSKKLNVDHRTYKPEEYSEEIEIDAVSIDDYLSELYTNGGVRIDFIKIDIQGFEMQAIQGMERTLAANKDIKLISEFWPYGLKMAGSSLSDYFDFLSAYGFRCYLLEHKSLTLLDKGKVESLEPLGEKYYFNIFATRSHV